MVSERAIWITEHDMERLSKLLQDEQRPNRSLPENLKGLAEELGRGRVVGKMEVPPDVITMNSQVRLVDLDTDEETVYTLVFPDDADIDANKISVLAPIGTAMLGYRSGDVFEWNVPGGLRRLRVTEVLYQPEAAGDYDL